MVSTPGSTANELVQDVMCPGSSGEYMTEYRTIGIEDGKDAGLKAVFFDDHRKPVRFIGLQVISPDASGRGRDQSPAGTVAVDHR
jgi:hypothetical protein